MLIFVFTLTLTLANHVPFYMMQTQNRPYFQHTLKAGVILSHLVWIMGPLSGLVVAPIVGVFSDRCTSSFGRRRPFMASGTVFCIIGMTLFANASRITNGNLFAARLLATLAFGVLDFATNVIMFPSRALLGDLLPSEQQHSAQSAAAVVASLAEICGGLYIYSWKDPVTHFGRIFAVASVCLAISCAVSLIVCVEQPLREGWNASSAAEAGEAGQRQGAMALPVESGDDIMKSMGRAAAPTTNHTVANDAVDIEGENEELRLSSQATESRDSEHAPGNTTVERVNDSSLDTGLKRPPLRTELVETVRTALVNFPRSLMPVGIVYGLAWFVWFASLPYYSQWLGVDVLHGDPHADAGSKAALAYERGVSVFSIANVVKASLALIFAAFYPAIVRFIGHIGERVVFSLSFLIFSSVLFACADTHNVLVAASVVALGSMPFIVTQTIPIAIVVQRYPENLASNLGVM